tara:strand:- start:2997 stop:3437 length:441 start_codon:yes stop_codon:yes gene_type:complete
MAQQKYMTFLKNNNFHKKEQGCPIFHSISEKNQPFFIKGFLDGDGSVSLDKNNSFRVSFNGAYGQSWDFLEDFLKKHQLDYNIYNKRRTVQRNGIEKIHSYSVVEVLKNKNKIQFCELMKKCGKIGLMRKVDVLERFLQMRKSKGL